MSVDWRDSAACLTEDPEMFFDAVWPIGAVDKSGELVLDHGIHPNTEALEACRKVCDACPSRRDCFAHAMEMEDGEGASYRFGVVAGTTPLQRWSIEHRKSAVCPLCGAALDPNSVRAGEITCVNWCDIDRTVPPLPDDGDRWTRRHTTLARKVVRWLVEEVGVGTTIPRPTALAEKWKERRTDMTRVYAALVADGTIEFRDEAYFRRPAPRAWKTWEPAHLALTKEAPPVAAPPAPVVAAPADTYDRPLYHRWHSGLARRDALRPPGLDVDASGRAERAS